MHIRYHSACLILLTGDLFQVRKLHGDPLDILILHEASTYPGVVLPCRPLGVVEMDQEDQGGKRERNDRVIVMPAWHDRVGEFENASDLPERLREEIEQFFLSTTVLNCILIALRDKAAAEVMLDN